MDAPLVIRSASTARHGPLASGVDNPPEWAQPQCMTRDSREADAARQGAAKSWSSKIYFPKAAFWLPILWFHQIKMKHRCERHARGFHRTEARDHAGARFVGASASSASTS